MQNLPFKNAPFNEFSVLTASLLPESWVRGRKFKTSFTNRNMCIHAIFHLLNSSISLWLYGSSRCRCLNVRGSLDSHTGHMESAQKTFPQAHLAWLCIQHCSQILKPQELQ
uniref:Uncharacterized protein n=1 Tax=Anguilla anguilla TaxID=7936 RepID=A0A0E9XNT2_ANGAN